MSLQRTLFNFLAYYAIRSRMATGLDLGKLRARDMPAPPAKRTWDCSFAAGQVAGVRVTYVRPARPVDAGMVVYLHGGAYVAGIGEPHWWLLSRVCHETGRVGVMVDYRLAPEHPFPAALDDAVAVLDTLAAAHGAANLVVAGDSAGGGLAVAAAMKQRDAGRDVPGKLILLSPWLDISLDHPDIARQEKKDRVLARPGLREAGLFYAGGMDPKTPALSPAYGDLSGLPPTLLQIGTCELLLPDSRTFRDKARAENAPLTYAEHEGMFHVWTLLFPYLPEGEAAVQEVLDFVG